MIALIFGDVVTGCPSLIFLFPPRIPDKKHDIARIIVRDAHEPVLHNGVKETLLTEV